ncbi:unnamed protein product [Boreogadus saida]
MLPDLLHGPDLTTGSATWTAAGHTRPVSHQDVMLFPSPWRTYSNLTKPILSSPHAYTLIQTARSGGLTPRRPLCWQPGGLRHGQGAAAACRAKVREAGGGGGEQEGRHSALRATSRSKSRTPMEVMLHFYVWDTKRAMQEQEIGSLQLSRTD